MKIIKKVLAIWIFVISLASTVYGERNYLGNLNSDWYDDNSVSNPYGDYGSVYSDTSINNPYGKYGSIYSNDSVNNPYATNAPILLNQDGEYRGILSTNRYEEDSISNPYGRYGSKYSTDSINNPYNAFDSEIYIYGR